MPIIPTFMDEFKHMWNEEVKLKGGVINTILMKDQKGSIHFSAIIMVYILPLFSVVIFYLMMKSAFSGADDLDL
jgi:hypothetical protein